ncbi:MAG TPA: hypothetical protein ENF93_01575, partial [Ignisphaera sp.]|nr:hypothetical protein [Ignisphaera sp.]
MTSSVIGAAGDAGNSGRIEVELPNKWRIEIIGNTENGGIWRLINTDSTVIASRTLPPHAYWPNNRYTTAYTLIDTIRTLYLKTLETNLKIDGCKDLKHYIKWYGKKYRVQSYTYLQLTKEGMYKPRYLFKQLLKTLGIYSYYIELREISTNRFRIELYTKPRLVNTWFLRGLAITDGEKDAHSFASPKNELLGAVLANCSAKISLEDIKLWNNEVKITLSLRINEKPFEWVNKVLNIIADEKTWKDLELLKLLPKTLNKGIKLLAGMITGDGFVNRLTKVLTISFSLKTQKGKAIMKILEHLVDLGLFEFKSSIDRVGSHREIKLGIPYEIKLKLAKLIPYYKGYRIIST